ncbi:MAG: DUF58 domain-containing protein [Bacteroidia bacterium]|nr:DUF58 domain-containing protein [Bacteroidia bacterium]MDW8157902.1 DUF58 domain-containing protein [Bacteroidia bacterium]
MNPVLQKLKKIRFKLRKITEAKLIGAYKTAFRGTGIEIAEIRPYQLGDDVRYIDWNVTARTGELHVKVFQEDRELNVILLIDLSASLEFANKKEVSLELATLLGYCAFRNQDKLGAVGVTDKIEFYFPCARGRNHLLNILDTAHKFNPKSKLTRLSIGLEYIQKTQHKRALIFILSDFIDPSFSTAIIRAVRQHEVILFRIYHPLEVLPSIRGILPLRNLETNHQFWLLNWQKNSSLKLQKEFDKISSTLFFLQQKHRIPYLSLNAQKDIVPPLIQFFFQQE